MLDMGMEAHIQQYKKKESHSKWLQYINSLSDICCNISGFILVLNHFHAMKKIMLI